MPFNEPLIFKPNELGQITQFPTFDKGHAGIYTPKHMRNFWDNIIHASASDTVLKKLTRTILREAKTVRISDSGNLERLLSLNDRLLMDHLLTPFFSSTSSKKLLVNRDILFNAWETFSHVSISYNLFLTWLLVDLISINFPVPLLVLSGLC